MSGTGKTYLGDSVYADFEDGFMIRLEADGHKVIWIEPEVFQQLLIFAAKCWKLRPDKVAELITKVRQEEDRE